MLDVDKYDVDSLICNNKYAGCIRLHYTSS